MTDEEKLDFQKEIDHALTIEDDRQQYEYVYDAICSFLDKKFVENNYCGFGDDNKCFVNREGLGVNPEMGCCYSFRLDAFMSMRDKQLCKHLGDKCCNTKCITCKLYTCKHLEHKGVSFNINDFKGIKKIFTKKQIRVLKYNAFKSKEEIIDRVIEVKNSKMPYFLFCLLYLEKVQYKGEVSEKENITS